jgi:outer membrane lipopolysaccharide assembly protein LptE/RlpB
MRSATVLPVEMDKTYIATDSRHSLFYRTLRSRLRENGVEVVDSPADATAVFSVLADDTGQRVLSVSASNIPQEYEVFYRVIYSVQSGEKVILERERQAMTRDYTYDVTLVLGKAKEEELQREAIVDDLVRVVLIQLSSLQDNGIQ